MKNIFKKKNYSSNIDNRIASDIGYAILNNYNGDYPKTYEFLHKCGFTNIKAKRKRKQIIIELTMQRPGIFIGKGGHTINYIKDYIKENNNGLEIIIKLKETPSWNYFLYPMTLDPSDWD